MSKIYGLNSDKVKKNEDILTIRVVFGRWRRKSALLCMFGEGIAVICAKSVDTGKLQYKIAHLEDMQKSWVSV